MLNLPLTGHNLMAALLSLLKYYYTFPLTYECSNILKKSKRLVVLNIIQVVCLAGQHSIGLYIF